MPETFATIVSDHLDAAYQLARWMTRDATHAEDVVQDSMVRALKYFGSFRGDNARAWLLAIVRNVALRRISERQNGHETIDTIDGDGSSRDALIDPASSPEDSVGQDQERRLIATCIERLPLELRECLVLREWEDLSYKEIAHIVSAPIGTVMSRLWRARQLLAAELEMQR